jgi:hypothetical protein
MGIALALIANLTDVLRRRSVAMLDHEARDGIKRLLRHSLAFSRSIRLTYIADLLKPTLLPDRKSVLLMTPRVATHPATARSGSIDQAAELHLGLLGLPGPPVFSFVFESRPIRPAPRCTCHFTPQFQ